MVYASLALNILVLIPVVIAVRSNKPGNIWGVATPARGILQAIYIAILVSSIALLFNLIPLGVVTLLLVQVIYKMLTPFTTGDWRHPVVVSNLFIAAVHILTLTTLLASGQLLIF